MRDAAARRSSNGRCRGLPRSFTLATDREWFIDAARHSAEAVSAATIVEVLSGAYITVSLADGRELTRQVPEGNTELPPLFDAMGAAAPAGGAGQ